MKHVGGSHRKKRKIEIQHLSITSSEAPYMKVVINGIEGCIVWSNLKKFARSEWVRDEVGSLLKKLMLLIKHGKRDDESDCMFLLRVAKAAVHTFMEATDLLGYPVLNTADIRISCASVPHLEVRLRALGVMVER